MEGLHMRVVIWAGMAVSLALATGCKKEEAPAPSEPSSAEESGEESGEEAPEGESSGEESANEQPPAEKAPFSEAEIAALQEDQDEWGTLLPTPGEVLRAVEHFGESAGQAPAWGSYLLESAGDPPTSRAAVAIAAGAGVTNFILLVHAKEGEKAGPLSQTLTSYAEMLGVGGAVSDHAGPLSEAVSAGNWESVHSIMDEVYGGIRAKLVDETADEDTATLVALGAWLEGVRVVAAYLGEHYSEDAAGVLRQGFVATHFKERLAGIQGELGTSAPVTTATAQLVTLAALMNVEREQPVSADNVKGILDAAQAVRAAR
jgi:hypothetical protein